MEIQYFKQTIKFLNKQDIITKKEHCISPQTWDNIDEIEPDEFDLMLLEEIRNNPECHEFVSQEEALKELELD